MTTRAHYRLSAVAVAAEFFGTLLFTLFGSFGGAGANGAALAVFIYCALVQSGGHLNVQVTLATAISGHTAFLQAVSYIVAQLVGAVAGAAIGKGLKPDSLVDPGVFMPATGVSQAQLFGWEFLMSLTLIVTVYAVAVSAKGAGNVGAGVIGLSLYAMAVTGGSFTGGALNFARVFGPAVVYHRYEHIWIYFLAHLTAGVVGSVWGLVANPPGPYFLPNHIKDSWRYFTHTDFQRAVPWSTAKDPNRKYNLTSTEDPTIPAYAKGNFVKESQGGVPAKVF